MWEQEAGQTLSNDSSGGSCRGTGRAEDLQGAGEMGVLSSEGSLSTAQSRKYIC